MLSESNRADLEDAAVMLRRLRREGLRVGVTYHERGVDNAPAVQAMPPGARMVASSRCAEDVGGWLTVYLTYEPSEHPYRTPKQRAQFANMPMDARPGQPYTDAVSIAGRALRQCRELDIADSLPDQALWHYSLLVRDWADEPQPLWAIRDTISSSLEAIEELIGSATSVLSALPTDKSPSIEHWPPDDGWHFRDGQVSFRGEIKSLSGKRLMLLRALGNAANRGHSVAVLSLRSAAEYDEQDEKALQMRISGLRKWLKEQFGLEGDPITSEGDGKDCVYTLNASR